jgi:hypothetical protein
MKTMLWCCPALLAIAVFGCRGRGIPLPTAPVSGKVTYQGKPLGFGRVTFFHPSGHAAGADIAADGAFTVNAYQGANNVSVECYEYQRPGSKVQRSRMGNDKSVIPVRYSTYTTSGLTIEIKAGDNKAAFTLTD